jgi:poly(ADP-ribose) glycohydrolase ARH3
MTQDQFAGCLLGLALGDALGAPHEGGLLERLVWRLIGKTKAGEARWTDDTQMALDVAESLIEAGGLDPDALAKRFAKSYRWSRGYGPSTTKVLKRIRRGEDWRRASTAIYRDGSFGNGAAMRAPVTGLFFASRPLDELIEAAKLSARITHAHPIGVEGAVLVAVATATALRTTSPTEILAAVQSVCTHEAFRDRLTVAEQWLQAAADSHPPARSPKRSATVSRPTTLASPRSTSPCASYKTLQRPDRLRNPLRRRHRHHRIDVGRALGCCSRLHLTSPRSARPPRTENLHRADFTAPPSTRLLHSEAPNP